MGTHNFYMEAITFLTKADEVVPDVLYEDYNKSLKSHIISLLPTTTVSMLRCRDVYMYGSIVICQGYLYNRHQVTLNLF